MEQFKCLVLLIRRKYPPFSTASVFQLCLCRLTAGRMIGGLLPDFLIPPMLPPWYFSAWLRKPTRLKFRWGKPWWETPEQEASLLPGVVLEGKLCTLYLDIYLKTNLFWYCSLSLLLSVLPSLSLSPASMCMCVCVCVHLHASACTHQDPGQLSLEVLLMSNPLPVPAGHLGLLPIPRHLLLKLCLPRLSSGMAVRWAPFFFLCGSCRDHRKQSSTPSPDDLQGKQSSTHSPDDLWECKPVASSIRLLQVLPPEKQLHTLRQCAFMFSRPT